MIAVGGMLLAAFAPIVFLIILAVAVGVTIWLLPKILKLVRRSFASVKRRLVRE